jgi:oligoribonuclease NrnB/cAMP/cGMP phosphodiesterase (DHH superfamily)
MDPLPKPDVILTHESDLDGLLSGVLLQRLCGLLFGNEAPLEACHYHGWRQREMREKCAWVSDFGFESRLDRDNWLVVDHHPPNAQPKRAMLIHDANKSAGTLCYELAVKYGMESSPALERLVHLNNVADLFLEDDPDFIEASDCANLVKTYQFWTLHRLTEGRIERIIGHPLLEVISTKRKVEDPIGYDWSRRNIVELAPRVGYVSTVVGNTNLILHKLLEQENSRYPVLISLLKKSNNTIVASLRSRNGEALKIAELLRGGGHPNASGATLPQSVKTIDRAIEYMRKELSGTTPGIEGFNAVQHAFAKLNWDV